jgi:NTE family protein
MTIGLVLGGGGSRGLAHVGVLKVLTRERIPIDLIVGTSMGGIVGVLFALGISPDRLASEMMALQNTSIINVKLLSARARQRMLRELLARALAGKTFADLEIPTTLMVVDMISGNELGLNHGSLLPAVLATSAVPAIFPPVMIDGAVLADGGVIDSLATRAAYEQGADRVIAVDIEPNLDTSKPWQDPISAATGFQLSLLFGGPESSKKPNMFSAMWRAYRVLSWHVHTTRLAEHRPDVLLLPDVGAYGSLDFKDIDGPLRAGEAEAEKQLAALKALAAS